MTELERLGRQLADEQDALRAGPGEAQRAARTAVRERIAQHELTEARAVRLRPSHIASAAGVLAAAAAAILSLRSTQPAPLTARLGTTAARVLPGAWLEAAAGNAPLGLQFSDGTRVELEPGTRARLVEVGAHGAHLMIESGEAHVSVRHAPGTAYRLSMGPFVVRVIGTRFDLRWDPEHDDFHLDLREGRVELSGCVFERGYTMRTGQSLSASCRRGRFELENTRTSEAAEASVESVAPLQPKAAQPKAAQPKAAQPEAAQPEAAQPTQEPEDTARAAQGTTAPERAKVQRATPDWRALARRGEYAAAYGVARDAGFAAECARADAEDLALLAEAARYAGQRDDEAEALVLLRRRFAGTPRAALAAFGLGRLEFDERHAYAKAARWFDSYLKEQPAGALAREARGRLLEATLAAGDRTTARGLASEYLREHPQGPHGALARRALDAPAQKHAAGKPASGP